MFGLLKLAGLLRVDRQSEIVGMDIVKHGEPAYPVSAYGGDYRHLHDKNAKAGSSGAVAFGGVPIVMPTMTSFTPRSSANDVDANGDIAVVDNSNAYANNNGVGNNNPGFVARDDPV